VKPASLLVSLGIALGTNAAPRRALTSSVPTAAPRSGRSVPARGRVRDPRGPYRPHVDENVDGTPTKTSSAPSSAGTSGSRPTGRSSSATPSALRPGLGIAYEVERQGSALERDRSRRRRPA
jgi:hypothetical protein